MSIFVKDPEAVLDYEIDWEEWLSGETIASSVFTVPVGITNEADSNTATVTLIRLSGGTDGVDYLILNHIVTSGCQEDERTITIQVRDIETSLSALDATVGGSASNSYVTLTEAKTYFLRKLYTDAWDNASDEDRENALIAATMQLDQLDFVGTRVTDFQALEWPREDHDLIKLTDEQQLITKSGTVSVGTFTISFDGETTSAIAFDASRSTIQTALEALTNLGVGKVFVEGGPISTTPVRLIFQDSLAETDVDQVTIDSSLLTGGGTYVPSTSIAGGETMIPKAIKEATYELAIRILAAIAAGLTGVSSGGERLGEVDLGPIKLKYDRDASSSDLSLGTLIVDSQGIPIEVSRILRGIRLWPTVA